MCDEAATTGEKNKADDKKLMAVYQAATQHWIHNETERWSILNNFLLANSIILLACAAVFAASDSLAHGVVILLVLVFTVFGLLISLAWLITARRSSKFIKVYGKLSEELEKKLELEELGIDGPFQRGEELRNHKIRCVIERAAWWLNSRRFMMSVPVLFAVVYVAVLTLCLCFAPGQDNVQQDDRRQELEQQLRETEQQLEQRMDEMQERLEDAAKGADPEMAWAAGVVAEKIAEIRRRTEQSKEEAREEAERLKAELMQRQLEAMEAAEEEESEVMPEEEQPE